MAFSRKKNDIDLSAEQLAAESKSSTCRQMKQNYNSEMAAAKAEKERLLSKCKSSVYGHWQEKSDVFSLYRSDTTYQFTGGSFNRCLLFNKGKKTETECKEAAYVAFTQCTNEVEREYQDRVDKAWSDVPSFCKR